jgi:hypothetical protein
MTRNRLSLCVFALGVWLAAVSCDPASLSPTTDPPAGGSAGPADDPNTPGGIDPDQPDPADQTPSDPVLSVGDVSHGPGAGGDPLSDAIVTARVRNESNLSANVTLRFIAEQLVAHQAFVRVLPGTITSVGSPRLAESLEVTGTDGQGSTLQGKTFVFGIDFDERNPAEYIIPARSPDDGQHPDDPPPDSDVSSMSFIRPHQDITVAPGTEVIIEWIDESTEPDAIVDIYMRKTDATLGDLILIGDSIPAGLDGTGDKLLLDVSLLEAGTYQVIGELDDFSTIITATAPGLVHVIAMNDPPTLNLTDPASDIELRGADTFLIAWTDSDENDNARITLSLEPDDAAGAPDRPIVTLISDIEEDDSADQVILNIPPGVAKGAYRVKGAIADGSGTVVSRAPGIIFFGVSFPPPPEIIVLKPFEDQRVRLGDSIDIQLVTTDAPTGATARLKLTNQTYGGTTSVTVLDQLDPTGSAQITLVGDPPLIANDVWPRRFDLVAELVTVTNQAIDTHVAPGSIWIRQEVEISDVAVNYSCPGGIPTDSRLMPSIVTTWFGGGFEEGDTQDDDRESVRFWLSKDGEIPPGELEDETHRLIHAAAQSPNVESMFRVLLSRITSLPVGEDDESTVALEEGLYWLITVVETDTLGMLPPVTYPSQIEVCLRLRQ